jgi:AcrR family transcriptional regulator
MIKTEAPVLREPKQERSRRSFERVQDAALALLVERGPDAFTLAEVCTRADASMGAIYNRVNGKDDLIRLIHERQIQLGQVDEIDVEATVLHGDLLDPPGDGESDAAGPHAPDDDHE